MLMNTSLDAPIADSKHHNTNINIVMYNVLVTDSHENWNVLFYKEALKIKERKSN